MKVSGDTLIFRARNLLRGRGMLEEYIVFPRANSRILNVKFTIHMVSIS